MKKSNIASAVALALGAATALSSITAHAALTSSSVLSFTTGVTSCVAGNCIANGTDVTSGSWFGMDANGNGSIQGGEKTPIAMHDGIHLGTLQPASGSHSGNPFGAGNSYTGTNYIQTGQTTSGAPLYLTDTSGNKVVATTTEHPGIDEPWGFFGNTGMDYTTKPIVEVGNHGTGTIAYLDFSGWTVTWNGIGTIPMNAGAWGAGTNFGNGVAQIACDAASCSQSSNYTLDYFATVPLNDPSGFGGVKYTLHLVGHNDGGAPAVPVPAAAWLFGSGLLGLIGMARRKAV